LNDDEDPAIIVACRLQAVGIVRLLLEKNADVTLKDKVRSFFSISNPFNFFALLIIMPHQLVHPRR
jgi:hypothetical protein